ncbi:GNAT family N-acetyltransferase [Methanoculleus sp. Wushi-C6]|uniref:GNAT family N-acetyltransferase n=1 Tax=Methanoculleus caldifontis TaxID=2651577 RepID=A0ABU3X2R6_9EURY|nr:GNAT family N-acetyltransferase [Methanoculleus sp. Wushi-C6]MDV2482060.1 GNAT family N-acetyltransferase [Methanoculleus sp. Wushi-C6]
MFTKVLIPTDLSVASMSVAQRLREIPGIREVVLFHARVSAGSLPGEGVLRGVQEALAAQGFSVETVIEDDDGRGVSERILRAAAGTGADLIAMGVRDHGLLWNPFAGNVAAAVLREARVHILIAPQSGGGGPPLFARLLVPTDLSPPAPEIRSILERPAGDGAAVLLHVVEPGSAVTGQEAGTRLALLKDGLTPSGREVRTLVRTGDPARTICAVADELGASAVVIPRIGKRDAPGNVSLGSVTAAVAGCAKQPVLVISAPTDLRIEARELRSDEFAFAEEIWTDYHQLKADRKTDRIFGVFADGTLVSVARCRRHPDGYEVDGVFTPARFRGKGYARRAMDALVEACQHDTLYMHSVLNLVEFYGMYGFVSIPESDLPPTIRARFAFALGEMEGANVQPMRRVAGPFRRGARDGKTPQSS